MPLLRASTTMASLEEPAFVRRVSLSLVAMGLITGAGVRIYRAVVLQYGWSSSWLWIAGTLVVGAAFLLLMCTLHLGNYPVKSWLWRAPAFAIIEAGTEVLVSLALTLLDLEQAGSARATMRDWPGAAQLILLSRGIGIPVFALVLAAVTTVVRLVLLPRRHHLHDHPSPPPDAAA